jgi:RHS repeat-associated protein
MRGAARATAGENGRTARRGPSPSAATLRLLVVLGVALLPPARAAWAQATTLYATADTYLKSGAANQNVGSETVLRVQSSGNNRALVRFDHAAIAAAVGSGSIVSATLELYVASNGNNWGSTGRTVDVHRLSANWTEAGATWSCPVDSNPSNSSADCSPTWGGGSFAAPPTASVVHANGLTGWVQFDVAEDVAAFLSGTPDHGWILKKTDESASGEVQYTSLQGTAAQRPRLVLVVESAAIDETAPSLAFTQPTFPVIVNNQSPAIALQYADGGSGVDPATFHVLVDGQDITGTCSVGAASASCVSPSLSAGDHVLSAQLSDHAGNQASATYEIEVLLGSNVTVTLGMRYDTYLQSGSPNQNQGAETILRVRSSGNNRALVVPDTAELFTVLGEEPLFSATLELYIESNGNNWGTTGRTVDVHRVNEEWTESETTWNCTLDADTTNSQPDCETEWNGGTYEPLPTDTVVHTKGMLGWVQFDVTQDVHAIRDGVENLGWIVRKTDEAESGEVEYASKEGNAAHAPRLVLVLGPGGVDETPPALRVTAPSQPLIAGDSSPTIALAFQDTASGIDAASLHVLVDATEITPSCTTSANAATCEPPSLPLGPHTITARISDTAGNEAVLAYTFELFGGDGSTISILSATADNFLRAGAKNRNEGDQAYLRVKSSGKNRALVRFSDAEIAALGPTPVDRAILELYIEKNLNNWGTSGRTVELHRMSGDWTELGSTWNCAIDTNTSNTQPDCNPKWNGGTFDPAVIGTVLHTKGLSGWIQFDVTAELNAFLAGQTNYGWIVKKTDERLAGFVKYTSREGTAGLHPRLVVAAGGTLPTPTATATVTPTSTPASTATSTATSTSTSTDTPTPTATPTNTATPTVTDTATPTATDTPTPTATDTDTPTPTNTSTPTRTATPTSTDTATSTPTNTDTPTATPTDTPTDTATPTSTPTATSTPTPTSTDTSTPTPTSTPIPPGFVVGEVFDDGNALPLGGASAAGVGSQVSGVSDGQGRYALNLPAGPQLVELTKEGYTRSLRAIEVAPHGAASARDARLSALADPTAVGSSGGTLVTSYSGAAGSGDVELDIPSGAMPNGSEIRLTVLSPQGLVAPVPLGWSVLLGADIQASTNTSTSTTLRIPFDLVLPAASLPVVAAMWDEQSRAWIGGAPVTAGADFFSIELPGLAATTQVALLVADSIELEAVEGEPLPSAAPAAAVDPTGLVVADPEVIYSGPDARSHVFAEVFSAAPLVSGTLIEARLGESYDRLDGSKTVGAASRQDVSAYRVSVTSGQGGGGAGTLAAHFAVGPSLTLSFSELLEGRIQIDTVLSEAGQPALLDANGGSVAGAGVDLFVPPGAASPGTIVAVDAAGANDLPAGASPFASFNLTVGAGSLDPQAEYRLDLGAGVGDGDAFVVGRTILASGRLVLQAAAFGRGESGLVVVQACETFDSGPLCLAGFGTSGTYAIFRLPTGLAAATGTATDPSSNPAPGLVVESTGAAVVAITSPSGAYVLPIPATVTSMITTRDPTRDLAASGSVSPAATLPPSAASLDLTLQGTPPEVIQIDPPNHASNVAPERVITVTFSEALAAASVTSTSVRLTRQSLNAAGDPIGPEEPVAVRLSLRAGATELVIAPNDLLAPESLYRLTLTDQITDLAGNGLTGAQANGLTVFDFTTSALIRAEALPPNTLRVSLPEDGGGNIVPTGEEGTVFVCGGPQLAFPGTDVVVRNRATGLTVSAISTDNSGASGSTFCDTLFPGRCDTSEPGTFCAVLDAIAGDGIEVEVEDSRGNIVTLDAGNMRDERTGAEVVGPDGGTVTFPGDERYRAYVPPGAFLEPTLFQLTPIEPDPDVDGMLDLFDPSHPELQAFLNPILDPLSEYIGAVKVDLDPPDRVSAINYDVTVPVEDPPVGAEQSQYFASRIVNFRGLDELTMIDTAFFEPDESLVVTDPGIFPGLTFGGTFGLHRWKECMGFVSGWVNTGDNTNPGANVGGGLIAPMLPFPIDTSERVRWTVPQPCNQPVEIFLYDAGGEPIDSIKCDECAVGAGGVVDLPGALSDSEKHPGVFENRPFVPNGQVSVSPSQRIEATFDESMDPASLPGNVELSVCGPSDAEFIWEDCDEGPLVAGHPELTPDGRIVVFVPDVRLRYGLRYRLYIHDLYDIDGQPQIRPYYHWFSTDLPEIMAHIDVDARDVAAVPPIPGVAAQRRFIAVAEGDTYQADSEGGVVLYEVTNPTTLVAPADRQVTAAVDRAIVATEDSPLTVTGGGAGTYQGPFLMTIDGPGGHERYGAWRIFNVSANGSAVELNHIDTRIVNLSRQAHDRVSGVDAPFLPPTGFTDLSQLVAFIPIEIGVPVDVASLGVQRSYIANTPFIGLQAIHLPGMSTDLDEEQVSGNYRDTTDPQRDVPIRAVATLPDDDPSAAAVLAVAQEGNANVLLLTGADVAFRDRHPLPDGARPLAVTGLKSWPVRFDNGQQTTTETRDLAVVSCEGGLCTVPVFEGLQFTPNNIPGGPGRILTPGDNPRGTAGDRVRQMLHLADGNAGLSIVDFLSPGGSIDETNDLLEEAQDGIDDRVLGTLPLPYPWAPGMDPFAADDFAKAVQVARWDDAEERPYEAVATAERGVYVVSEPLPLDVEKPRFKDCGYAVDGDVIGCEDQTLGQVVGVVGTPYTLHYQSDRTPGGRVVQFRVSDAQVPPNLAYYEVIARVAGREFAKQYDPEANLELFFAWDGKDDEGRVALGAQLATIEVREVYVVNGVAHVWNVRVWGGTLGGWDTRAQGLGGWSVNVHHFFDPLDRILYLGSGRQRSANELGVVQEDPVADEVRIASENGLSVFVFDRSDGRHLRTINALTHSTAYEFEYDGDGQLTAIRGDGLVTTVGNGLTGPYGDHTSAGPAGNDFWTSIGNAAGEMSFVYTPFAIEFDRTTRTQPMADGLLVSLSDPNSGNWAYDYDARGRLKNATDADSKSITASRSAASVAPAEAEQVEEAYTVTLGIGQSEVSHQVKEFKDGSSQRNITTPDGNATFAIGRDLTESGSGPWGTFERVRQPGQRLSINTNLPFRLGSFENDFRVKRTDPLDLLSVEGFTQRSVWNGKVTTLQGSGTLLTSSTPAGRSISAETDSGGRPLRVKIPGMPDIEIQYDGGRPTEFRQGSRVTKLGYSGAFASTITDPTGRVLTVQRDDAGRVSEQTTLAQQSFEIDYDANGNLKRLTHPETTYEEHVSYSPVDVVTGFTTPAGLTTIDYSPLRRPTGGSSPHGVLTFDEGILSGIGATTYTYDDDGYLTKVENPEGNVRYEYSGVVPNKITWSGQVSGSVTINRDDSFHVTRISVGSEAANFDIDADGVISQAGALLIERDATTLTAETALLNTTELFERNEFRDLMHYDVRHAGTDELFSEDYERDRAGRITAKTVRIRKPAGPGIDQYRVSYEYDAPGRLQRVAYNGSTPAHYDYDARGNLVGEPAGTPPRSRRPLRLYFQESGVFPAPTAFAGDWEDTMQRSVADMGAVKSGSGVSTTISADCSAASESRSVLGTVFVSPPVENTHTFDESDQLSLVFGAAQAPDMGALFGVASIWVMNGANGSERCVIRSGWDVGASPVSSVPARGQGGSTGITGSCLGTEVQPGDRIVLEVGVRCGAEALEPANGFVWRGGEGPALASGAEVGTGTDSRPGYLQIDAGIEMDGQDAAPCPCGGADLLDVQPRRLLSVTVDPADRPTMAVLQDPEGADHTYQYSYDPVDGSLASKTETATGDVTAYDYDSLGNLRTVTLPNGSVVTYLIDAAGRRVGKVVDGLKVQGLLYQSTIQPVAELAADDSLVAFFVYADKPNVPEYMVKGGSTYRLVTDHVGSVRLVVDATTGTVAQRLDYDEHGNVILDSNPGFQPFGFAGGLYDPLTKLTRFGARDYDAEISRWTVPDPSGFVAGDPTLRAYVANDPVNLTDPDGLNQAIAQQGLGWVGTFCIAGIVAEPTPFSEAVCAVVIPTMMALGIGVAVDTVVTSRSDPLPVPKAVPAPPPDHNGGERRKRCGPDEQLHHIATNKHKTLYTSQLNSIFARAGLSLKDDANLICLKGHKGRHSPRYHDYVLDKLDSATRGLSGSEAGQALRMALNELRNELIRNPQIVTGLGL